MTVIKPKFHIFILIFTFMLVFCPAAFGALEKSSKKECAMCHVMWLDVFRTQKETLIEWQPGNVLMKDTQGVVSSEELCYSCHDGYVADSRYIVWKDYNHTVYKKPSENIRVPDRLTLSNRDELYCGTCHSPHSGREAPPGASPEETVPGPTSFLRLPNTDSGLCEGCHVNEADTKRTGGHPVHTDKLKIPDVLFELGSVSAKHKDTVICQTCHKVHGATGRKLTVMDNSGSSLCMTCHKERTIIGTAHDVRLTMPAETNLKGQPVSESGPCGACHIPHNGGGQKLWARKTETGNPASQMCLSCHNGKPDGKRKTVGLHSHPMDADTVSKDNRELLPLSDGLPLFSRNGKVQPAGSVQCFTCHDVHQWDPVSPEIKGGKEIEGDGSNSFLRVPSSRSSALCVECHRDKKQVLSFDHNLTVTAPEARNIQGNTAEVAGPCGACHIPHNASDGRLWARAFPEEKDSDPYCSGCHVDNGEAKDKQVGTDDHPVEMVLKVSDLPLPELVPKMLPVDTALKELGISPPEEVSKRLPLYNEAGTAEGGIRITCRTCHNPHIWTTVNRKDDSAGVPGDTTGTNGKNIEGDARNSFLRMPASTTPDLCVVCHANNWLVVGTDHDLFVTAPTAENLLGETVVESGQCGVCHAVHNSPNKLKLFSRKFGPVVENQHPMNALCTSCHSKGEIAEDKIPPIATHPEGRLIENVIHYKKEGLEFKAIFDPEVFQYTPIFDDEGNQTRVGNLSCSSCHNAHQWSALIKEKGGGDNVEGNSTTSFLRTLSYKNICVYCHREDALFRYRFFHSPERRSGESNTGTSAGAP